MKKSTLRNIIREEINNVLTEAEVIPTGPDGQKISDVKTIRNLNLALKSVNSTIRPKLIALIEDPEAAKALVNPSQKAAVLGSLAIAFGITERDFSQIVGKIKSVLKSSEPNEEV